MFCKNCKRATINRKRQKDLCSQFEKYTKKINGFGKVVYFTITVALIVSVKLSWSPVPVIWIEYLPGAVPDGIANCIFVNALAWLYATVSVGLVKVDCQLSGRVVDIVTVPL